MKCVKCHKEMKCHKTIKEYSSFSRGAHEIYIPYCDRPECPNYKLLQVGD